MNILSCCGETGPMSVTTCSAEQQTGEVAACKARTALGGCLQSKGPMGRLTAETGAQQARLTCVRRGAVTASSSASRGEGWNHL